MILATAQTHTQYYERLRTNRQYVIGHRTDYAVCIWNKLELFALHIANL